MKRLSQTIDLARYIDRKSFMLGMITAFAECVAGECKRVAFSPPFYPDDYNLLLADAQEIIDEQGLYLWYEENLDIPEDVRVNWFVIYKFPEVLEEYKALRKKYNPAYDFDKFREFLSYGIVWGENAKKVKPKMRKKETIMGTVARILFKPGEWPPPK
ncbi:MAG TPA: hypothetical protein PLJ57_08630 [Tepidanaerobacteraceae bacterium]|jgi:hypothetical protein|nr:hypothetical protein [Tepidanaerobacteraceae bacterium]